MDETKFIRLDIALIPPEGVAEEAIALSQKIGGRYGAYFVLDGKNFFPHITVYAPEYPDENLDQILEAVAEIAKNTNKINLTGNQFETHQGFLGVKFDRKDEIVNFHAQVVQKLNPLRLEHVREKYKTDEYQESATQKELENILKYGYPSIIDLYNPHLTIIRLKYEKEAQKLVAELRW